MATMMGNAALASPDLFEPKPRYIATRPPLTRGEHAFPKWQRIHSRAAPARNFVTASTRIR